jgi:hypothetical protein
MVAGPLVINGASSKWRTATKHSCVVSSDSKSIQLVSNDRNLDVYMINATCTYHAYLVWSESIDRCAWLDFGVACGHGPCYALKITIQTTGVLHMQIIKTEEMKTWFVIERPRMWPLDWSRVHIVHLSTVKGSNFVFIISFTIFVSRIRNEEDNDRLRLEIWIYQTVVKVYSDRKNVVEQMLS